MPRKVRGSNSQPTHLRKNPAAWGHVTGYSATAVISAMLGIAGTLGVVRSREESPKPAAPAAAAAPSSSADSPPDSLTRDLPPDQAARTLGNWYYDHKSWALAVQSYKQAIAAGMDNPDIRTDLGNAYRFADQPDAALEQYRTAHKQNSRHENSLFNQGALYAVDLGDAPKAVAVWRTYLKEFPEGSHAAEAKQLITVALAHSGINTSKEPAQGRR